MTRQIIKVLLEDLDWIYSMRGLSKEEAIKYSAMCKLIVGKNSIFLIDSIYDKDSYNILVVGKHVFKKFSQISKSLLNNYDEIIIDAEEVENISLNNFRYVQDKELSSINSWKKV